MVRKTKRASRIVINPGGIEVEGRVPRKARPDWGRRQSDNQAYPKFKPDKSALPRGLTAVPGTRRTIHKFKWMSKPTGEAIKQLPDYVVLASDFPEVYVNPQRFDKLLYSLSEYDEHMLHLLEIRGLLHNVEGIGGKGTELQTTEPFVVTDGDRYLAIDSQGYLYPKYKAIALVEEKEMPYESEEMMEHHDRRRRGLSGIKRRGRRRVPSGIEYVPVPEEPDTSSREEDRYAGTQGHNRQPWRDYVSLPLGDTGITGVELAGLDDTSVTGGPYADIDQVPDRTYLYRIPFRTVGASRATSNLKVRATTKQNALGEANEILAKRYPGGKFIIRSKSVRRLSE